MNITIQQSALLRELGILTAVVDRKVTIPILSGVKLTADADGGLSCVATNCENALTVRLQADVVAVAGSVIAPLDTLLSLVQRFPAGPCALSVREGALVISAQKSSAKLPTFPLADYPTLPFVGERAASVSSSVLLDLIGRVRYAMSESNYFPAGANCSVESRAITMSATDGYQIVVAKDEADQVTTPIAFSIADRAWDALTKALKLEDDDTPVAIAKAENVVVFATPTRALSCRLVDKPFPQIERVIPKKFAFAVTVPSAALRDTLKRHLVVATADGRRMLCAFVDGVLTLRTLTVTGSADDELPVTVDAKAARDFGINSQFFLNTVDAIGAESVEVSLSDDERAIVCRAADNHDRMTATIATMRI